MIMTIPVTVYACDECKYMTSDKSKTVEWLGDMNNEFSNHYCSQDCKDSNTLDVNEE